ncbi:MAG: hypothetical protein MR009_07295 [Sutterellaceae bacterium]|nr:hypothetical protein [Sutterellaceae bacterium]MDD7442310.1 hypothetical protein [Sutterellaceae bacterium]MDY2868362.1 hypothetical protein [Mesosutterella sp.]
MKRIRPEAVRDFLSRQASRRAGRDVVLYVHDVYLSLEETAVLLSQGADPEELPRRTIFTLYSAQAGLPFAFLLVEPVKAGGPESLERLRDRLDAFGVSRPTVISSTLFADRRSVSWMLRNGWHFILSSRHPVETFEAYFGKLRFPSGDEALGEPWRRNPLLGIDEQTRVLRWETPGRDGGPSKLRRLWAHGYYDPGFALAASPDASGRRTIPSLLGDYGETPVTYYHTIAGGLVSRYGVRLMPNALAWSSVRNRGFSMLLTNSEKEAFAAANAFRRQDFQYDLFSNLAERFYLRPFSYGGSEPEGVLLAQVFLQFLGLVFFDATRKEHSKSGLWAEMYHTSLLDELDTIQRYTQPGKGARVSALTPYQKEIYGKLGVRPPGSGRGR